MSFRPKKWSYSCISTFTDCPLKFKYRYVENWQTLNKAPAVEAAKGSCFHETIQYYHTGMSRDSLVKLLDANVSKYNVDAQKYDVYFGLDRFIEFWKERVAPKEQEGYAVRQEFWVNDTLSGDPTCGALDLLLEKDDSAIIYDYKTGKTASTATYKKQILLYALFIGRAHKWSVAETAEKIKAYLFFPLTEATGLPPEDDMLSCLREIEITKKELSDNQALLEGIILSARDCDFSAVTTDSAKTAFSCRWCDYAGSLKNDCGFQGCPASYQLGYRQDRATKFRKKL